MKQIKCQSKEEFDEKAKSEFINSIAKSIADKGSCLLAIPGGRSVVGVFELISEKDLDWSKVTLFMIDERMVPIDHKESNFAQARKLFIDRCKIGGVYPFDKAEGVEKYNALLEKCSVGKMAFDVVLLSAGEDGHIGGLYPDHHSVRFEEKKYFTMTDSPKPPPERMTASRQMIADSGYIVLLFLGNAKRNAYENFMNDRFNEELCPAKTTKRAKEVTVLTLFE